jgi:TetR/AcrR family transcriptional regulator, regulator of cefoperazone and chloramphenicol sensitivity
MQTGGSVTSETRQRLLDAAGEIFAEQGFRHTTVRDICQRAGANIAAVNYHFGDKEGLYAAVLRYAHQCATEKYSPEMGLASTSTVPAEQRLQMFVRSFLLHIFDEGEPAWHGKLMAREMMEPTPALEMLVKEEIRPRAELLESIVRELLGRRASPERVRLCAMSIIGQCIFYHHARPVIMRLDPRQQFSPHDIERVADHVTRFSLAALKQLAGEKDTRGR